MADEQPKAQPKRKYDAFWISAKYFSGPKPGQFVPEGRKLVAALDPGFEDPAAATDRRLRMTFRPQAFEGAPAILVTEHLLAVLYRNKQSDGDQFEPGERYEWTDHPEFPHLKVGTYRDPADRGKWHRRQAEKDALGDEMLRKRDKLLGVKPPPVAAGNDDAGASAGTTASAKGRPSKK